MDRRMDGWIGRWGNLYQKVGRPQQVLSLSQAWLIQMLQYISSLVTLIAVRGGVTAEEEIEVQGELVIGLESPAMQRRNGVGT